MMYYIHIGERISKYSFWKLHVPWTCDVPDDASVRTRPY